MAGGPLGRDAVDELPAVRQDDAEALLRATGSGAADFMAA